MEAETRFAASERDKVVAQGQLESAKARYEWAKSEIDDLKTDLADCDRKNKLLRNDAAKKNINKR